MVSALEGSTVDELRIAAKAVGVKAYKMGKRTARSKGLRLRWHILLIRLWFSYYHISRFLNRHYLMLTRCSPSYVAIGRLKLHLITHQCHIRAGPQYSRSIRAGKEKCTSTPKGKSHAQCLIRIESMRSLVSYLAS